MDTLLVRVACKRQLGVLQYGSDANHLELASVPVRARSCIGLPYFTCNWGPQDTHTSGKLATNPGGSYDDVTRTIHRTQESAVLTITVLLERIPTGKAWEGAREFHTLSRGRTYHSQDTSMFTSQDTPLSFVLYWGSGMID